jgi:hypothetical protein
MPVVVRRLVVPVHGDSGGVLLVPGELHSRGSTPQLKFRSGPAPLLLLLELLLRHFPPFFQQTASRSLVLVLAGSLLHRRYDELEKAPVFLP